MLLFLNFIFLSASEVSWFENRSSFNHEKTYYGYGKAAKKVDALAQAKSEIASSLSTTISSKFVSKQERRGDQGSSRASSSLKATTNVTLTGVRIVREKEFDGLWYVLARYDDVSLEQKAISALKESFCINSQNSYLSQTPLIASINKKLGCKHPFKLKRRAGQWYINMDDFLEPLSKSDFDALFKTALSQTLALIPSSTKLYEDDVFSFNIQSKKSGFVSLLTVYEDGKIGVLMSNEPISDKHSILFPKVDANIEMVAGLVREGVPTKDLYILLFTPQKADMTRFESVSDELITQESEFRFGEVIDMLEGYEYSTLLLRTKPKKSIF